jgi:hypothetical protein
MRLIAMRRVNEPKLIVYLFEVGNIQFGQIRNCLRLLKQGSLCFCERRSPCGHGYVPTARNEPEFDNITR